MLWGYFVDDAEMTVAESVEAIVVVAPRRNAGALILLATSPGHLACSLNPAI